MQLGKIVQLPLLRETQREARLSNSRRAYVSLSHPSNSNERSMYRGTDCSYMNIVCSCFSECPGSPHELLARWVGRSSSMLEVRGCRTQFFFFLFALLFIINQTILLLFFFRPNLRDSLRIPKGGLDDPPQRQGKRKKGSLRAPPALRMLGCLIYLVRISNFI